MGKDIQKSYKHGQSQLSTLSFKSHVRSYLSPQTSSSIELATISVHSNRDKQKNSSVLCYKIFTHNFVSITNNANKNACETTRKINQIIPTTSTPNHHAQRIATTSANI